MDDSNSVLGEVKSPRTFMSYRHDDWRDTKASLFDDLTRRLRDDLGNGMVFRDKET